MAVMLRRGNGSRLTGDCFAESMMNRPHPDASLIRAALMLNTFRLEPGKPC